MIRKMIIVSILIWFVSAAACVHSQPAPQVSQSKIREAYLYAQQHALNTRYCIFVDMSVHSGKNRFFVWNFQDSTIVYSSLCCHGIGGGSTQQTPVFSNTPGSYCTSLGKYSIGQRSYSNYGIHIHYKLHGLESTNSNAFKRIVVLHSYDYVSTSEMYPEHLPLGYSLGCPVIDNQTMKHLDALLQKQTKPLLLWIYN